jgi:hypothetical protein
VRGESVVIGTERPRSRALTDIGLIFVSCLGATVAYWLAPASIQFVSWTPAGPSRIALFAPLSRLWLALAVAMVMAVILVVAGREARIRRTARAQIVAPLSLLWLWTMPYWPWLPDRAPALLVLAGPVRWLIAAAAIGGVVLAWRGTPSWAVGSLSRPGRREGVFVFTLALFVVLGLRSLATIGLGGDEPHYLIITHSLLVDHDLKIENNHANRDYRAFFAGDLRPDYMQRGKNGEIYSIHSPGLSALLLPGYALAGARGAVLTMCLLGALTALAVFDVAMLLGGPTVAFLTWASVCLTVPFVPHAWMLYPETAGGLIVAWAVIWLVRPAPDRWWLWMVRGASLAALPWLHTKFVVFLAVLGAGLAFELRVRPRDLAALIAPIVVSCAAWLGFFLVVYGSLDPQVPYGAYTRQFVRFENIPRSLLGIFIDQKFGLLVYAPVYLGALAGFWVLLRESTRRTVAIALLATTVFYVISSTRLYMWWGGSSAPARFLVPVLPLLAPAMAAAFASVHGRMARATMGLWLAWSLLVAAVGVALPERAFLFSTPHGIARLLELVQESAPVAAVLPTFTEADWTSPLGRFLPWAAAAGAALGLGWLAASRARRLGTFWIAALEAVSFVVVGSVLSSPVQASVRADAVLRGRTEIMMAYEPERLRGFDYGTMSRLDAAGLLKAGVLTLQRSPDEVPDPQGRVAGPLGLPPGRYQARVWFASQLPPSGDLLITLRRGNVLARTGGALTNPATLTFDMPARIAFWLAASQPSAARAVQQVEISPISIVPKSRRAGGLARAVEAVDGHADGYIVYVNDETYPEGGVFWTRAGNRADVLVAPAGSSQIVLTLHVGPIAAGTVRLEVAGQSLDTPMAPDETRDVAIPVPPNMSLVPISIQAPGWFRPASVDPRSTDTRALGCQVRVSLR